MVQQEINEARSGVSVGHTYVSSYGDWSGFRID